MKPKWCDRNLIWSPYCYTIVTSEKMAVAEMKRLEVDTRFEFVHDGADAVTHVLTHSSGKKVALVCFFHWKGRSLSDCLALIAHEAIHIWQEIEKAMREQNTSAEFEAYSVQSICGELFKEFFRQTRRENK